MIHLQRRPLHVPASGNPFFQFIEKHRSRRVKILFTSPHRKHEMPKNMFRYLFSPRHLFTCPECQTHVIKQELPARQGNIYERRISVEESQRLPLRESHFGIKHVKQYRVSLPEHGFFLLKINLYHFTVDGIGYKMFFPLTSTHQQREQANDNNLFHGISI